MILAAQVAVVAVDRLREKVGQMYAHRRPRLPSQPSLASRFIAGAARLYRACCSVEA
jgi:hypothetical protein